MAIPLQLPPGSVVLSNRFGDGPFHDCERFVGVVLPQGIEIEAVPNAASAAAQALAKDSQSLDTSDTLS